MARREPDAILKDAKQFLEDEVRQAKELTSLDRKAPSSSAAGAPRPRVVLGPGASVGQTVVIGPPNVVSVSSLVQAHLRKVGNRSSALSILFFFVLCRGWVKNLTGFQQRELLSAF